MRPRKLHPDSADVLADWRKLRHATAEDDDLVGDALRAIASRDVAWRTRWACFTDTSDESVTIIRPIARLYICVRLWADEEDQFELVRIVDQRGPASEHEEPIWDGDRPQSS